MIEISATYYDGKTPSSQTVSVSFYETGEVVICNETINIRTCLDEIRISQRIADTCRHLYLSDGSKLEASDNEAIDGVLAFFDRGFFQSILHKLENCWRYALIALFASIVSTWAVIEFGVPVAAKWTARNVPVSFEKQIGEQGLETLDELFFKESKLGLATIDRLKRRFEEMKATISKRGDYPYQLEFRHSLSLGANALALPGGIIIVTDALVEMVAENDDQLIAVLAHEAGHVENQHGLRSIFQDSLTTLFVAMILGDVTSITTLSASLPTILVETRYSRKFEMEADRFAVTYLLNKNIPVQQLSMILKLLDEQHDGNEAKEFSYLSTHPATDERINMINKMQTAARK